MGDLQVIPSTSKVSNRITVVCPMSFGCLDSPVLRLPRPVAERQPENPSERLVCRVRFSEGPACQVGLSEGPACQVRLLEGRACRVRCVTFDHPLRFRGHDKRAPRTLGGTRLSGPPNNIGSSILIQRARQACPSDSGTTSVLLRFAPSDSPIGQLMYPYLRVLCKLREQCLA
jgi:hypothetical protein